MPDVRLPVTGLSGFLGTGKTAGLNQALNQHDDWRSGVIGTDMPNVPVGADVVRFDTGFSQPYETLADMSDSSICFMPRDDLLGDMRRLAKKARFDEPPIGPTERSELPPGAAIYDFGGAQSDNVSGAARRDMMAPAVDAGLCEPHDQNVATDPILGAGRFEFETEDDGASCDVDQRCLLLGPEGIRVFLDGDLAAVIRAKGQFRLTATPDRIPDFSPTGPISGVSALDPWWVSVPVEHRPAHAGARGYMPVQRRATWDDRHQAIVVTSVGIDWSDLKATLGAYRVQIEFTNGMGHPPRYPNTFPEWQRMDVAA